MFYVSRSYLSPCLLCFASHPNGLILDRIIATVTTVVMMVTHMLVLMTVLVNMVMVRI